MRFFYDNLIDYDGVVITARSEQVNLPASNVANEHRKRVYRTGSTYLQEWLVFDLGAAKAVAAVVIGATNFAWQTDIVSIDASTDGFTWVSIRDELPILETIPTSFPEVSYRYWRIIFDKANATETRDIGRVFIGRYYDTPEPPDFTGYEDTLDDLSKVQKTPSGQTYAEVLDQFEIFKLSFSSVPQTMADELRIVMRSVGQHRSFFLQLDENDNDTIRYLKFKNGLTRKVSGFDSQLYYDIKLELEEQL